MIARNISLLCMAVLLALPNMVIAKGGTDKPAVVTIDGTVEIGNFPSVQATQDVDHPVNGIYQNAVINSLGIGDTNTTFVFPKIPPNHALIVEYVSIQIRVPDGASVACFADFRTEAGEVGRFTVPVTTLNPSPFGPGLLAVVSTHMTAYHLPDTIAPTLSCSFTATTQSHSATAVLVGHTVMR